MTEKIGLEAFFDTSKFKAGFAEYVASVDKMIFGTDRLSDAMEETAQPSVKLANSITDLGRRVLIQQQQLAILTRELDKMINVDKASAIQIDRKRLQVENLTNSLNKNQRTLEGYRQQVEAGQRSTAKFEEEVKETQQSITRFDLTLASFAGNTLSNLFMGALNRGKEALIGLTREAFQSIAAHEKLTLAIETLTARELLNSGQADNMAEAIAKSGRATQETLKWIEQLAVKSPFNQDDISATFRLAQAYGFTSEEAKRLTQVLTDFTAGTGQSGQVGERLALALGQISAKGKVSAEELNQLREAGFNVNTVLEGMGFTLNDVEKGLVNADKFIEAVVQTLERDFQGAAERQTESWSGLLSTLEDTKKIALREFFQATFDVIQPLVADFVAVLGSEEFRANLKEAGEELGKLLEKGIKLTQEVDWGVISTAFGAAGRDYESSGLDKLFNLPVAAEALAKGYLLARGGLAALNELAEDGGIIEYLEGGGEAADAMRRAVLDLNKEAEKLPKYLVGERGMDTVTKRPTVGAGEDPLSPQELANRSTALEKLNDAFEDYGEKTEEVNKRITKASQDYARKEQELQGDLVEAWQSYTTGRQEAASELYAGLAELEQDFNQAVAEAGQERVRLTEELNTSRLEADQDFNQARAKLEQDFNQAVAEIGQQRASEESKINEGRLEAEQDFQDSRAELERKHSETISDLNRNLGRTIEDFNRERLRSEEDFNRERGELEDKHLDKVRNLLGKIEDEESDSADKRLAIADKLQDDLTRLEDRYKDRAASLQDQINDILEKRPIKFGLGQEQSLSKEDRKRLEKLRKQLADEATEFSKQQADLEAKAADALSKEEERNQQRLTNLQDRLADENQAYTDAIAEQQRQFDQQEADRQRKYERAVEDLNLRLTRENEAFDRQSADIQKKLDDRLSDLQASYDSAVAKLDDRLAKEQTKLDDQRKALQGKYEQELIDIQQKHDGAVDKLDDRLAKEAVKYNEQRTKLQDTYRDELTDLETSYNQRVVTVQQKLRDIAVANAEKQLELREQMAKTEKGFAEKIDSIAEAWTGKAMDATAQYAEYLATFQAYLAQTEFPINFVINLPEWLVPGSPSPLEESLVRTEHLLKRVGSTLQTMPTLSAPTTSSPAMTSPPILQGGGFNMNNSFGDFVFPGGPPTGQDARDLARRGGLQVESELADVLLAGAWRQEGNFRKNPGRRT